MIGASEKKSAAFLSWERRGRGYELWGFPVVPEPVFVPYLGEQIDRARVDDGRKPTFLSAAVRKLSERLAPPPIVEVQNEREDRTPEALVRSDLVELQVYLPATLKYDMVRHAAFLGSLSVSAEPITFELIGAGEKLVVQFALHPRDERLFRRQFEAFFPEAALVSMPGFLENVWGERGASSAAAVELGLEREFMIPLDDPGHDPFIGLVGALSEIEPDEVALFQVIFAPVASPWSESIIRSVSRPDGSATFRNAPEILSGAQEKTSSVLSATVVRIAVKADDPSRKWEIACNITGALGAYGSPNGNRLVPLQNDGYEAAEHEEDVLRRQTHRSGMILNAQELAGFAHLPGAEVKSSRLRAQSKTKAAPESVRRTAGLVLGVNVHHGLSTPAVIGNEERVRHIHVIGASGTGKSSLLYNLIMQGIMGGEGLTVIDPHGDLIDRVLGSIPDRRIEDVVLLDPSDETHVVGLNILSAHSDWEKSLLASDLVSIFRRSSSSWGDQLNSVLHNAIMAFLESDRGGTLLDLRRFLLEPAFRKEFLKSVRDSNIVYYWEKGFPQLTGGKSVGPVITRLDGFLGPRPIRHMVSQTGNGLDLGHIMDSGKIFLARLPRGAIGADNAHLLGSLLVAKIQSEAMSRQRQSEASRRHHWLYADEFHDFLTPSLAECLAGVRKYRLGLVLSHQEMRQVERDADVASALLANAFTRIVFRVGDRDARTLESGFSYFDAKDIQNLPTGEAICRVERSDCDFNLAVEMPQYPPVEQAALRRSEVIESSRRKYAIPRTEMDRLVVVTDRIPEAPVAEVLPEEHRKVQPVVPTAPLVIAAPAPQEDSPKPAVVSADLGRGGVQHKAIQDRIKDEAEKLGFRVVVEKEILNGTGHIDLVLSRDDTSIACEVTVTTTIDHEIGNVVKCLKAGFTRIALVSVSEDKLAKLSAAVANSLGEEKAKCVACHLPDAFIASLSDLPKLSAEPEEMPRSRGGRTVKRTYTPVSPAEEKVKEAEALRLMAELMKRREKRG